MQRPSDVRRARGAILGLLLGGASGCVAASDDATTAEGLLGLRHAALEVGDAGAPEPEGAAPDAGASATDAGLTTDAGAPDEGAPAPDGIGTPVLPPPLPDDIVEQSRLPFHGLAGEEELSARGVWRQLRLSRAICLGELHNEPAHHNLQLRVLERLAELQHARPERRGELAIGYEMFQRPFQEPLSAYLRGELGEAALIEQTEYAQRWGADLALYRPLFEANRDQGLPGLALNAPTELTRAIGRGGLSSLGPEQSALLPELDLSDVEHRELVFRLLGLAHDTPVAAALESIYQAQVTWDETMAQTASDWLAGADDRRLLAFAGSTHCHESAIPRRITRRTGIEVLSAAAVFESELEAFPEDWVGFDLLIVLED